MWNINERASGKRKDGDGVELAGSRGHIDLITMSYIIVACPKCPRGVETLLVVLSSWMCDRAQWDLDGEFRIENTKTSGKIDPPTTNCNSFLFVSAEN
jgi:hypothetical protein